MQSENLKTLNLKSYTQIPGLSKLNFYCLSPQTENYQFSQKNKTYRNINISTSTPNRYGNFTQNTRAYQNSKIQINLAQFLKNQNKCQTPKIFRSQSQALNYNKNTFYSANPDRRIKLNFEQETQECNLQQINCCEQITFGSVSSQFQFEKNKDKFQHEIIKNNGISNKDLLIFTAEKQLSSSLKIDDNKNKQKMGQKSSSSSENMILRKQEIEIINSEQNIFLAKRKYKRFMSSQQISFLHGHQQIKTTNAKLSPFSKASKKIVSPEKQQKQLIKKKRNPACQKQQYSPIPKFLKGKLNKFHAKSSNNIQQSQKQIQKGSQISLKSLSNNSQQSTFTFKILKLLSKSNTTQVYLVCQKKTNFLYCIKKSNVKINQVEFGLLARQGKIGLLLNSPTLLQTYCTLYDDEKNIYQLIQFMQGETLYEKSQSQVMDFVKRKQKQKKSSWSSLQSDGKREVKANNIKWVGHKIGSIRFVIKTLLQAVAYMHSQGVIHRDIKPSNIFISHGNFIKLGDFGSCGTLKSKQYVGTLDYVAPETLMQSQFDYSLDIWAIGCIAYELYTGRPPFYDKLRENTIHNIVTCQYDLLAVQDIPLRNLISQLLRQQKQLRPTAQQALKHNFIQRKKKFK